MTRLLDTARAFVAAMDDCKRDALDPHLGKPPPGHAYVEPGGCAPSDAIAVPVIRYRPPFSTALRHDARDDARHLVFEALISRGLDRPFLPQDAHALSRSFADYYRDVLHTGYVPFREGVSEQLANTSASEWCKKINSLVSLFIRKIANGEVTVNEADDAAWNHSTSAVFADKGKRNKQEDRHLLVHDLSLWREPDQPKPEAGSQAAKTSFFAVFDGHGGSEVSAYAAAHMAPAFVAAGGVATEDCLRETFKIMDDRITARIEKEGWKSGSTAVVLAADDNNIAMAWAGDSAILVLRAHEVERLSFEHRPCNKSEHKRVEDAGGYFIYFGGEERVNGIINITRSLGDVGGRPMIIAEPDTMSIPRTMGEYLMIMCCDGVADELDDEDFYKRVCDYTRKHPVENWAKLPADLVAAADAEGSQDNMTCIVVYLRPPQDLWNLFKEAPDESDEEEEEVKENTGGSGDAKAAK